VSACEVRYRADLPPVSVPAAASVAPVCVTKKIIALLSSDGPRAVTWAEISRLATPDRGGTRGRGLRRAGRSHDERRFALRGSTLSARDIGRAGGESANREGWR
jgi:hypothetical protein